VFVFAPIRWAFKLLYFAVLAAIVYVVVSGYQVVAASHLPTSARSVHTAPDAVVLGAPLVGGAPGADLTARLQQALLLYQDKVVTHVLVAGSSSAGSTGGTGAASPVSQPEAERTWLVAYGVPTANIREVVAQNASTALFDIAGMLGSGSKVVVVTDAIDALWTKNAASKDGLAPEISPAVGSERVVTSEIGPLWREATGVAVGRLIGYGRATWAET
jgi:hypothetical protein